MSFHENLRFLRTQKGLKQKDVAEILKMPPNTYNGYETGKRMPNIELLKELSSLFEVSVDYLINNPNIREYKMETMNFGLKLKNLRENKNMTQEELGELLKVSKASISKYENNTHEPNISTMNFIADFFNVTTDYLLGRTDDPNTVLLESDKLPPELKDLDAIEVVKGAFDKGFSKDDIKEMLDFMEKINKKNNDK
jgi:transcriptional regulator with XRE-family HTH domain